MEKEYITLINKHIDKIKNSKKCYILVGILDDYFNKLVIPLIPAKLKFFIKINPELLLKQRNIRLLNYLCKNKTKNINLIKNNNFYYSFSTLKTIKKEYKKDYKLYTKYNYKPMTQNSIYNNIIKQI